MEPVAFAPTITPRKIVTVFISPFCAVLESLVVTPDSLKRLPSISIPSSGIASGSKSPTTRETASGNTIFSSLETVRSCFILIFLSLSVVKSFIIGF